MSRYTSPIRVTQKENGPIKPLVGFSAHALETR